MPARTRVTKTEGGGFGGFAPNPTFDRNLSPEAFGDWQPQASEIHPPVLTSLPPSNPRSTPAPQPNPRPTTSFNAPPTVTDASGAGLAPSGLGGNTLRSLPNDRWSPDSSSGSAYADLGGMSGGAEVTPTIASGGGKSPPFISDPNEDWMGSDETRVAGPRKDGLPTEPGTGDDPALFADEGGGGPLPTDAAPTNEWTTSPNDRRFLPSPSTDPGYMANFGGNMTLGQFLNTPLAFLRFGEGRGGAVGGGNVDLSAQGREQYLSGGGRSPSIISDPNQDWTGSAEGYTPPEVAAMSEEEKADAFAAAERQGAADTAATTGAPSTDPASRYGNVNSPTGRAVYRDAQGNWRPVSGAPSNIRWDPNNPHNSNFTASKTTEGYVAGGGDPGRPNDPSSFASEGRFLMDDEGNPTMQGAMYGDRQGEFQMDQKGGAPAPYGNAAAQLAYNNWLRQQPEYKAWMKTRGG